VITQAASPAARLPPCLGSLTVGTAKVILFGILRKFIAESHSHGGPQNAAQDTRAAAIVFFVILRFGFKNASAGHPQ